MAPKTRGTGTSTPGEREVLVPPARNVAGNSGTVQTPAAVSSQTPGGAKTQPSSTSIGGSGNSAEDLGSIPES